MKLCDLPKDIIKLIIQYIPCGQWFRLSKEFHSLASQVISPLDCRIDENGSLCWSLENNKIMALNSILNDPRVDPSKDDNFAIRFASRKGHKEIVQKLLTGTRS
jgi:hypothetical protein